MKRKKLSWIALLLLMFFALGIVAESVALAAPIGEWKFDEGHGILTDDSSDQGKTGRLWGSTIEWVEGIRNKALQFAGSADYVQVPPSVASLGNWSVTAYIKPTGSSGGYVYSEKDSENNLYLYISITADNRIKVATRHSARTGGWDIYQTDPGKVTRNEWNHLVVTLENGGVSAKSGIVKCFVNGRLVGKGRLGNSMPQKNLYGASWIVGEPTTLDRRGACVAKAPGADFDNFYPWNEIMKVEKDGQSTVKIPRFYYKREYDGMKHEFWIASYPAEGFKLHPAFDRPDGEKDYVLVGNSAFNTEKYATRAQARTAAKNIGQGWYQLDIQTWSAIQILWLVEHADTHAEKFSDNYRGITGLWSLPGRWVDGVNVKDSRVYISENYSQFADGQYNGDYKDIGFILPQSGTFITDWHYSEVYDWLFVPSAGGGSASTYITDVCSVGAELSVGKGPAYSFPVNGAGIFHWGAGGACDQPGRIGSRYIYIP